MKSQAAETNPPKPFTPKCKHKHTVYIGIQERPNLPPLKLFNCLDCKTTISRER